MRKFFKSDMKNAPGGKKCILVGLFFVLALLSQNLIAQSNLHVGDYATGQLLVKIKDTAFSHRGSYNSSKTNLSFSTSIEALNSKSGFSYAKLLTEKKVSKRDGHSSILIFFFSDTVNIPELIQAYEKSGNFEVVEPNYIGYGASIDQSLILPNDQHLERQWYVHNDGTFSMGTPKAGADIQLDEAWDIEQGSASIIVATLDSGIETNHPEFKDRLWSNPKELLNNIDDDDNQYTDDLHGWNFVTNSNDIADDNGHGTHIAGVLAANGNNTIGYAGVDWNCKIMVCKVLDNQLSGLYSNWIEGIHYAVDNGARVINMSLGGSSHSKLLQQAVDYANSNNVLIITSMQNDNSDEVYFPAGFDQVIAVGSTDPDDQRTVSFIKNASGGSNYGDHIDVVAPGNYIYGLRNDPNDTYTTLFGGTSLATPIVSGIACLILAQNPSLTVQQLKSAIFSSSEDQVGNPSEDTPGWDRYYGFGRVNAFMALTSSLHAAVGQVQISPIPAHDYIDIALTLEGTSFLELKIISINGAASVIASIPSTRSYTDRLLLSAYSSGLYVISFKSRFGTITRKILIIH